MRQFAVQRGKQAKSDILTCREMEPARIALWNRANLNPMETPILENALLGGDAGGDEKIAAGG